MAAAGAPLIAGKRLRKHFRRKTKEIIQGQLRSHEYRAPCCLGFGSSVLSAASPARALTF
jgi:hypothetical protein